MRMTGLVYINSGGWVGSGVNVVGDVKIVQKQPLAHRGRDNRYLYNYITLMRSIKGGTYRVKGKFISWVMTQAIHVHKQ